MTDLATRESDTLEQRCADLVMRIEANRIVGTRIEAKVETLSRYFEQLLTLERICLPPAAEPVYPMPPPVYRRRNRERGGLEPGEVPPYIGETPDE